MVQLLLGKAFKRFGLPLLVTWRGLGCERGRWNGRAELALPKEEERMEGRLKGWRRDDLHGMRRRREQEWEAGTSRGLAMCRGWTGGVLRLGSCHLDE